MPLAWYLIAAIGIAAVSGFGGWSWRDSRCDAAQYKQEADSLRQRNANLEGQLKIANEIQKRDADRAALAEEQNRKNQELINETPVNTAACLDRDASRRVRSVK